MAKYTACAGPAPNPPATTPRYRPFTPSVFKIDRIAFGIVLLIIFIELLLLVKAEEEEEDAAATSCIRVLTVSTGNITVCSIVPANAPANMCCVYSIDDCVSLTPPERVAVFAEIAFVVVVVILTLDKEREKERKRLLLRCRKRINDGDRSKTLSGVILPFFSCVFALWPKIKKSLQKKKLVLSHHHTKKATQNKNWQKKKKCS